MDSRHKADARDLERCKEKLAETRRRHKADAAELERCRESLRIETADAFKAWTLVDQLADALEAMHDLWVRHCAPRVVEEDSQVIAGRAALVAAGRIEG